MHGENKEELKNSRYGLGSEDVSTRASAILATCGHGHHVAWLFC